ncbi:MAG: hypothetical protein MK108_09885 [Mariniblastus sp.]|nr:hypothetical protein [Mariniblastus sp.]
MVRIASILLFLIAILMATDCQAQRFRPFKKSNHSVQGQRHSLSRSTAKQKTHRKPLRWLLEDHQSAESRAWSDYYASPASPLPKYIGGFHSSHFYNLGVPNGDIGFRGNGIYWAPW